MLPISDAAVAYIREKATDTMVYTCKIERVNLPGFDQSSGRATPGSRELIYEGQCRVWEVSGSGVTVVNEDEIVTQSTQLSLPYEVDPIPKRKDEVLITDSGSDPSMVGRRFVITSHAMAGDLRPTRRFTVTAVGK